MPYEHILVDNEDGVATLTLNRPEVLNAMNFQLSYELHEAMAAANADDQIGCIILTGTGQRAFSAGGDIHEQREVSRGHVSEFAKLHGPRDPEWSYYISASPKPVIGMMNGLAHGGGSVLASSLDFRVGCEHCNFRFLAAAYGRINCTWTLPNQVGWPVAKELLFTGRVVEAEEAYRLGLLNHLVPCEELRPKTMELATAVAKNRPETVQGIKQLLLNDMGANLHQQWENERKFSTEVVQGWGVEQAFGGSDGFLARRGRP
jgi:enoyl-CoA hydratase/carnithine racemase